MITSSRSSRALTLVCMLLIALAAMLTMGRLFSADFTNWDDAHTIVENQLFAPPTLRSLGQIWSKPIAHLYVPVTYTTWWLLSRFSYFISANGEIAQRAVVFHAANILLHAGASLVVFALIRRLISSSDDSPRAELTALAGAMLFAVHPVQVEAVGWCSGLKDVLGGLLSAVALLHYVTYAQRVGNTPPRAMSRESRRAAARSYVIAFIAMSLATLSKPTAMVVPLMALAIELFMLKRRISAIARGLVPLLVVAVAGAIEARQFQLAIGLTTLVSPIQRISVALDAVAFYLWKLIAPISLTFDYGRTPQFVMTSGVWRFTIFAPLMVASIVWIARQRVPALAAGAVIFLCGLLPVLGFSAFDFQEYSTVADHYLYLPMIGVAVAISGALSRLKNQRSITIAGTVIVFALALLIIRSVDQTRNWMNTKSLMTHAIDVNPRSWVAFTNYGQVLFDEDRYEQALLAQETSLSLRASNPDAHLSIGAIYLMQGKVPDATREFETALREQRSFEAHVNLAYAYGQARRFDDAIKQYKLALELSPGDKRATRMLERTQAYLRERKSPATTSNGNR